jgi:hypothetical protein
MIVSHRLSIAILSAGALLGTVFLMSGCCDPVGCGGTDRDFPFPLEVGNRWEYDTVLHISDPLYPLGGHGPLDGITFYSDCTLEVSRTDSLSPTEDAYVLLETVIQDTFFSERERWYSNRPDGLFFHAYQPGTSVVAPKPRSGFARPFSLRGLMELDEAGTGPSIWDPDSLIYEDPPLRAFPYPPQRGYEWMYRPPGDPWHINKRITGTARIRVPAGLFDCYEVQWLMDFHEDGHWDNNIVMFDYVAPEGLIRRSSYHWLWLTDVNGDTLGMYEAWESSELVGLHLE